MQPEYWNKAIEELSIKDPILKTIIENNLSGMLTKSASPFLTLIHSIIGQQLSIKAAGSIEKKLKNLSGMDPKVMLKKSDEDLRECGLSRMKIKYIKDISSKFINNELDLDNINLLNDDEIIKKLIEIKGIGLWTAHMFLIFHLNRPNILPIGDVGLINSIKFSYNKASLGESDFSKFRKMWSPWCTVASWYLWRNIDNSDVSY